MNIAVFGLGKLGSVIAAIYAANGHNVIGVDLDADLVASINAGVSPVSEPGLDELISQAGPRLMATMNAAGALKHADLSFVIVPTPSGTDGAFTNKFIVGCLEAIGSSLQGSERRHTVVICSTVMPGSCTGELKDALERASGKRVGQDIGIVYSPAFIALGSVLQNMQYPDLVLIGESDPKSGDIVEEILLSIVRNSPSVRRMNLVNAEIVKIAINTFVTTKISFANMLGEICDNLEGGDVDIVTGAVGSDSRIGPKYLKGALGYGGPCFPRDNIALTTLAESLGLDAAIARATDTINNRQAARVVSLVAKYAEPGSTIAILGLSYKPDTPVYEASQGVEISNKLAGAGFEIVAFDPQVKEIFGDLDSRVQLAQHVSDALFKASGVVITTAWHDFQCLSREQLHGKFVIDPWGVLDSSIPTMRLGKLSPESNS